MSKPPASRPRRGLPYAAAFDVKPPEFFAILAAAQTLFGPTIDSMRAVAIVFGAFAATGMLFSGVVSALWPWASSPLSSIPSFPSW